MRSTDKTYNHYWSAGSVFVKQVTVPDKVTASDTLAIGGVTYTPEGNVVAAQTDKIDKQNWAYSFAEAINAHSGSYGRRHYQAVPNPSCFARCVGDVLLLIGRIPGDDFAVTVAGGLSVTTVISGSLIPMASAPAAPSDYGIGNVTVTDASYTELSTSSVPASLVLVKNEGSSNIEVRYVGQTATVVLEPGATIRLPVSDVADLEAKAVTGSVKVTSIWETY